VAEDWSVRAVSPASRPSSARLKASTLRSYIQVLVNNGWLEEAIARVPSDTRAVLVDPPLASTWVDFVHIVHVTQAVEAIAGMVGVREFARRAFDDAKKPHHRLLEGLVRLFGTSPATVFKRLNELVKSTVENLRYCYTPTSTRSGVLETEYLVDYEIPTCVFVGQIPALQGILDACGVEGIIGNPERLGPNKVNYRIQW
jgi:hypothetical protein